MRILLLASVFLCTAAAAQQPPPLDLLIRGGSVVDGTGADPRRADVAIRGGRIVAVGEVAAPEARRVIDATGLMVAPGFIDAHTHADNIASRPEAANFVLMGVTTIVSGNCGGSNLDVAEHFARLDEVGISLNYATLIGHGTVRRHVMERAPRAPGDEELERMRALVRDAMRAGAVGLSTGLIYVPGTYADTDEIVALAEVVAAHGGVYATHMRNESTRVLEAIEEALRIGREADLPVHLSHLKASGKVVWGDGERIVARLRRARAEGLRVTGDQYAYAASSTSLDVLFPAEELRIGREAFAERLGSDPRFREEMRGALRETMERTGFGDLAYCRIAHAPKNTDLNGKTLAEAALERLGADDPDAQAEIALRLYQQSKGARIGMIYHKMSEDDVATIMREPYVAVACDAGIRVFESVSRPHPRGCGNNPRVLARYVRELGVIPMALAIHKMTRLPARIFGFEDRGVVRPGARADLTVFDPETVRDRATYADPKVPPEGIPWVIVNGVVMVERGEHTRERPGMVLRHAGPKDPDRAPPAGRTDR